MQQLTGPKLGKEYDKAILSPCLFNLYAEYIMLNAELNESQAGIKIKWSEVAQSCLTLCNPVDCSPPGSSIHGILQARVLEWVAISFSRGSSWPRDRTQVSRIVGKRFNLWATREAQEKYQQPQICRWYHSNGRKRRGTRASRWGWKRRVKKKA